MKVRRHVDAAVTKHAGKLRRRWSPRDTLKRAPTLHAGEAALAGLFASLRRTAFALLSSLRVVATSTARCPVIVPAARVQCEEAMSRRLCSMYSSACA